MTIKELYEYCTSEYITEHNIRYGQKIDNEEELGEPSLILNFSVNE